jgi:hypothetical protein
MFRIEPGECLWDNVDDDVLNPTAWLRDRLVRPTNLKSPFTALTIVRALDPAAMKARSRSFRKFDKEVALAYAAWLAAIQA